MCVVVWSEVNREGRELKIIVFQRVPWNILMEQVKGVMTRNPDHVKRLLVKLLEFKANETK